MTDNSIEKERQGWIDLLNEHYLNDMPLTVSPKHCSVLAILLGEGETDMESFKKKLAEREQRCQNVK